MDEPENNEHGRSLVIGNTSDAIVESQSTQLLDFVLGRAEPPPLPTSSNNAMPLGNGNGDTSSADHSSISKGSVDASCHASASVVPYHFHGLASTQTQTQTQIIGSDASQKENERDHGGSPLASRPSDSAQPLSRASLTPSRAAGTNGVDSLSADAVAAAPPQPTKVVSFLSPTRQASLQKAPTKTTTMRYRRHRPPPIPSQDSFAGPTASQDPDLFIATSRQFEIPLDQLGKPHSQERSPVDSHAGKTSVVSSEPGGPKLSMDDYSLSSSSSAGNILVANSDSNGPSQDSHRNDLFSISQEATQILGDASDASVSEHADADVVTQVIDDPVHEEPVQAHTQEATQLIEQSPSVEVGTSAPEPSVVSNAMSLLSLVPPEKRQRYMHHFTKTNDAPFEPSPARSESVEAVEASVSGPSPTSDRRSLLNFVSPEKRARYMRHLDENSVPVSEVSRIATAGTSQGSGFTGRPRSPLPVMEEVVQDSEQHIEMDISPMKGRTSRDQEVIPQSESDAPDCSREEDLEEMKEVQTAGVVPLKSPLGAAGKGKQKAVSSPRKSGSAERGKESLAKTTSDAVVKKASTSSPARTHVAAPAGLSDSHAIWTSTSVNQPISMGPPPKPRQEPPLRHGYEKPSELTKNKTVDRGVEHVQTIASSSAAAMHRSQRSPALDVPESDQDSPEIPLARLVNRRMEEEESENEEAERVIVGEDEKQYNVKQGPLTRKRKRRHAALTTKKSGKGKAPGTRKGHTRATSAAPPPSKKVRTTIAKKFGAGFGTHVFALFKSDSSFYGAEVHSLNGNRAHVKFFDGLEDSSLGVAQVRRFELRKGDTVISGNKAFKAKVIDDSLWATENEVSVEYVEGPEEGLEFTVPADGLRIPARIIQSQWKDRMLDASDIVPAVQRKLSKDTPSPSKNSVINAGSSRAARNRLLSKNGIIITQGPGNQNWSREKERYINIVKDNGGTMLSDWQDILTLQGKHTNGNKRWTIRLSDVKYAPKDKNAFDRVFLVSDVHNQKPKFLVALALGIPCVSVEWLDHLASGGEEHWSRFLLAAGHSEPLGARVSQMVDLDWGSTAEHLTEIMENPVPQKVLSGASVLCVGSDLFPHPAKKNNADADRHLEASRTVPRIILAMGAERVEAVTDAKNAFEDLSQYTYVVVKETILSPRIDDATYVDVAWIKECLIAGRLLPVPEWE